MESEISFRFSPLPADSNAHREGCHIHVCGVDHMYESCHGENGEDSVYLPPPVCRPMLGTVHSDSHLIPQ